MIFFNVAVEKAEDTKAAGLQKKWSKKYTFVTTDLH